MENWIILTCDILGLRNAVEVTRLRNCTPSGSEGCIRAFGWYIKEFEAYLQQTKSKKDTEKGFSVAIHFQPHENSHRIHREAYIRENRKT